MANRDIKPPSQIAAEKAAREVMRVDRQTCREMNLDYAATVTAIIQAAIEEALMELSEANDNLFKVARKHSVENAKLRAAHGSDLTKAAEKGWDELAGALADRSAPGGEDTKLLEALRHIVKSNHGFKPSACDGCAEAELAAMREQK